MNHKQSAIFIDDEEIYVDSGIADLLQLLNDWNFITSLSCEDNNGTIWLNFPDVRITDNFMQFVLKNDSELYEYLSDSDWSICYGEETIFHPYEVDTVEGTGISSHSISLRFPKDDYPKIKQRLFNILDISSKS